MHSGAAAAAAVSDKAPMPPAGAGNHNASVKQREAVIRAYREACKATGQDWLPFWQIEEYLEGYKFGTARIVCGPNEGVFDQKKVGGATKLYKLKDLNLDKLKDLSAKAELAEAAEVAAEAAGAIGMTAQTAKASTFKATKRKTPTPEKSAAAPAESPVTKRRSAAGAGGLTRNVANAAAGAARATEMQKQRDAPRVHATPAAVTGTAAGCGAALSGATAAAPAPEAAPFALAPPAPVDKSARFGADLGKQARMDEVRLCLTMSDKQASEAKDRSVATERRLGGYDSRISKIDAQVSALEAQVSALCKEKACILDQKKSALEQKQNDDRIVTENENLWKSVSSLLATHAKTIAGYNVDARGGA